MNATDAPTLDLIPAVGTWVNPTTELRGRVPGVEAWEAHDLAVGGALRAVRFLFASRELSVVHRRHLDAWLRWHNGFNPAVVPPIVDLGQYGALTYIVQPLERVPTLADLLSRSPHGLAVPVDHIRRLIDALVVFLASAERSAPSARVGRVHTRNVLIRCMTGARVEFALPEFGLDLDLDGARDVSLHRRDVVRDLRRLARQLLARDGTTDLPRKGVPPMVWSLLWTGCTRGGDSVTSFSLAWMRAWNIAVTDEGCTVPIRNRRPRTESTIGRQSEAATRAFAAKPVEPQKDDEETTDVRALPTTLEATLEAAIDVGLAMRGPRDRGSPMSAGTRRVSAPQEPVPSSAHSRHAQDRSMSSSMARTRPQPWWRQFASAVSATCAKILGRLTRER